MVNNPNYIVAVVGAGPAGLFAAKQLACDPNTQVVIFNKEIKPGGLAEYGIYPDKCKMKDGLRAQFHQILAIPNIEYYGNAELGKHGDLTLDDLRRLGFQAIMVTVGAEGTKWLGLPGEGLKGVYHAKDIVYHYNRLPPYSQQSFLIGKRVAVIGVGNVMLDVVHWLSHEVKAAEVIAVARRGPNEIKFEKKELEYVVAQLDLSDLDREIQCCLPQMEALGQNPDELKDLVRAAMVKADPAHSDTRFTFIFLVSPWRMLGDADGRVCGLEVENNTLVMDKGEVKARGLGSHQVLDVDTVIFAIGDKVDDTIGLPIYGNEFVKNPAPRFPVDGLSYEAFEPHTNHALEGIFVAGWSRKASTGLVGVARKDGVNGAKAAQAYLKTLPPLQVSPIAKIQAFISQLSRPVVTIKDLALLETVEKQEAQRLGLEDFKFGTNEEMLNVMKQPTPVNTP